MAANIDIFGLTDVGRVREENEDQFFIASLEKSLRVHQTSLEGAQILHDVKGASAHLCVVADGCGGMAHGRQASGTAVEALVEPISQAIASYYSYQPEHEHEFLDELRRAVELANETVKREVSSDARGSATTLTMATLIWPRAYVVHVGDSRAYYFRHGELRRITRDQTMAEHVVDEGLLTEEQALQKGLDHVLTSAIGGEISPTIGVVDLAFGDVFLLCTDGLTKHVSDREIAAVLAREDLGVEAACRSLVDAALDDGGTDNVTVVAARMLRP